MPTAHRPSYAPRTPSPNVPERTASLAGHAFLIGVAVTVFVFAVLAARWRPLWYDELFTFYVAKEPSVLATLRALLAGADTNPPLDCLVRHVSLVLLGSSAEAFRWPSAAAFITGLFAIYAYARRRAPFLASTAAFLLPISTAAAYFSYEGRAYALLFASAPLALVAWQRAVDRPKEPIRILALIAALCIGPLSHYVGVLNFAPVAAGETWRSVRRRQVDWGIVAALAGACVITLILIPFARNATAMKGAFWASGYRLADLPSYYTGFLNYAGATVLVVLGASLILAPLSYRSAGRTVCPAIPAHEVVAAVVLALTPISAFVLAELITGALTSKYAITLVPGVAILAGYLLAVVQASARIPVFLSVTVLTVFGIGNFISAAMHERGVEPVPAEMRATLEKSSLPVAFDSPHLFLEWVYYEQTPAAKRFVYPMDAATALAMRGFNNDEIALRGLSRVVPINISDYAGFTSRHSEFLVLYSSNFASALVRALQADGFCFRVLARSGPTTLLKAARDCE
jgi:hypothetical protein